jgi:hypothetical protein
MKWAIYPERYQAFEDWARASCSGKSSVRTRTNRSSNTGGDVRLTLMSLGFLHGDGWFDIIWRLCEDLEPLVAAFEQEATRRQFEVLQVKALRIHVNDANDAIRQRIEAPEGEWFRTCEVCGQPGKRREGGWIKTFGTSMTPFRCIPRQTSIRDGHHRREYLLVSTYVLSQCRCDKKGPPHVNRRIVRIDKRAPSSLGPAIHRRRCPDYETAARVACCSQSGAGRNTLHQIPY